VRPASFFVQERNNDPLIKICDRREYFIEQDFTPPHMRDGYFSPSIEDDIYGIGKLLVFIATSSTNYNYNNFHEVDIQDTIAKLGWEVVIQDCLKMKNNWTVTTIFEQL